jgi:hypothetical protein
MLHYFTSTTYEYKYRLAVYVSICFQSISRTAHRHYRRRSGVYLIQLLYLALLAFTGVFALSYSHSKFSYY